MPTRHRGLQFQFQTGAIKSILGQAAHQIAVVEFQFQTGAIKSFSRLQDAGIVYRFNSKLVRLKVGLAVRHPVSRYPFQFQTGAIKRFLKTDCPDTWKTSFNSKLVRLKVEEMIAAWSPERRFNSKLVRLKGARSACLSTDLWRFNSKLVRLKGPVSIPPAPPKPLFQFQTGAIKRCLCCRGYAAALWQFQFQTGAIKSFVTLPRRRG